VNALEQEVVEIHEKYAPGLLRYAAAMSRDPELARDAVQDVMLRYFVERRLGRVIDNPRAWVYRVLRNHVLDRLSSAQARCEVEAVEAECAVSPAEDADVRLLESQAAREMAEVLTGRELDCLRLRAEGLSYAEIAGVMGIQSGTVGALLARVRRKIREAAGDSRSARRGAEEALLFWARGGEAYSH
jgi:RNA polymerase sigma-70 factor, ECF subfamily